MDPKRPPRLLVIGAGPMGLEAAIRAEDRGWEVAVIEAGRIAEHPRRWGHIPLFTPLGMDLSPRALDRLRAAGHPLPDPAAILTGAALADLLAALAATLARPVRTATRALAVSRRRLGRAELPGHPLRARRPFEVLIQAGGAGAGADEGEETLIADGVLDATGTFGTPRWSGRGGPAPGERAVAATRHPPDIAADPDGWRGAVLLIGSGHSAAHAITALADLRDPDRPDPARDPVGPVAWLVPDDRQRPVDEVAEDPLPDRARLARRANDLAAAPPPWLRCLRRAALLRLRADPADPRAGTAEVETRAGAHTFAFDRMISLTGYAPDPALLSGVAAETEAATGGSRGLGAALSAVKSCLDTVHIRREDLASGEPDLHVVGHKSYGARSTFLLQSGAAQLDALFEGWALRRRD